MSVLFTIDKRSLIKILNNKGPSIDPWVPLLISITKNYNTNLFKYEDYTSIMQASVYDCDKNDSLFSCVLPVIVPQKFSSGFSDIVNLCL